MAIKHLKFLTSSLTNLVSSNSSSSPSSSSENKSQKTSNITFNNKKEKIANFRPDVVENESYQLGFKECLSETLRFLVEFEGFSLNQDFVQYPGNQSTSPPQNGESLQSSNGSGGGGGGGFHLTKLVAHLNSHLDRVVESRLKHPQEISSMEDTNWPRNQFPPPKNSPFEIKVTSADEMGNESDMPMDESSYELRNMLVPDSKRNLFQRSSNDEMSIRRELMGSPVLSTSSQSKGSYKKEIKDRFLRMRVQSGAGTNDNSPCNQDQPSNTDKPSDGPNGSTSTFFSSSASSSSGSSNGSLSSHSSMSSFPVFHPNNRGRSYSVNTYGPLSAKSVLTEIHEQKERNLSNSAISIFGFALHPSRSYYIPFHSKTTNLHETLTNALLNECNSSTIDQNLRNLYPVSVNVKFDSVTPEIN